MNDAFDDLKAAVVGIVSAIIASDLDGRGARHGVSAPTWLHVTVRVAFSAGIAHHVCWQMKDRA